MKPLDILVANVLDWGKRRNIIGGSSAPSQMVKLLEEYGELASGVARGDVKLIKDSIGDCLVVAILIRAIIGDETSPFYKYQTPSVDPTQIDVKVTTAIAPSEYLGRISYALNRPGVQMINIAEQIEWFIVALEDIAHVWGTTLEACLLVAWDEIKDRKGHLDPATKTFVKEADVLARLAELDRQLQVVMDENAPHEIVEQIQKEALEVQDLLVRINR